MTKEMKVIEALVRFTQNFLQDSMPDAEDKTLAVSCAALFRDWVPGAYKAGDIRLNPATGYPKECMIDHDSSVNTDWTIEVASIWKPYHSRKKEYALPFESPTGSHDIYKAGEYMIYNDKTYLAKEDTSYSPGDYAAAWEVVE